ncbi:hypothetical protein [Tissierella praeacuta]|uniref:hypothetical protein n=1 Tax=Tissierella praeacuta TaxID=43131 RepID=UPI002FDABE28
MEYTRSIGDIQETFKGTPEEIAELIMRMPETVELQNVKMVDTDEIISGIDKRKKRIKLRI